MNKAGAVGQAQNDATGSEEWDEERLEVALKQLQLLHVKVGVFDLLRVKSI